MHLPIIHVMHVLTDTNVGGAGTLLCNQLACLDRRRFYFTVVLPRHSRLRERLAALPLPCHVIFTEHAADLSADARAIGEYVRIFRAHRPDVVHTHAALSARIAARLCRVPVLVHTRHCVFPLTARQKTPLYRAAFRTANHMLSDGIIAVAHAAKQQLIELGLNGREIRVIINGVAPLRRCSEEEREHLRRQLRLPADAFVIGMVARLEPYKGQATVLQALARCVNTPEGDRIYLLLCGDGSDRAALQAQADALGIADRVRFVGFCRDVAPYYAVMDVNVNASYGTETSSLALSEGMSVGIPAVASRFGGNPYMVREGVNGLLFPPEDAAAAAAQLLRLLRDEDLRHRLARGARSVYEQCFTARRMTEQLEEYYCELYRKKQRSKWRKSPAAL